MMDIKDFTSRVLKIAGVHERTLGNDGRNVCCGPLDLRTGSAHIQRVRSTSADFTLAN
jgi:hypothetical protein